MVNIPKREHLFETPLGTIRCGFKGNAHFVETKTYPNGQSVLWLTAGHQIEMVVFKLRPPHFVMGDCGWIFRIEKRNDTEEALETYCILDNPKEDVEFSVATGEHLDAIEGFNADWTVHIGSEDGEMLHWRAQDNDWFPSRLKNKLDIGQSITELHSNGLRTTLPSLYFKEKLHLQYLVAYDAQKEGCVNSWLAVDDCKRHLEKWIGIE